LYKRGAARLYGGKGVCFAGQSIGTFTHPPYMHPGGFLTDGFRKNMKKDVRKVALERQQMETSSLLEWYKTDGISHITYTFATALRMIRKYSALRHPLSIVSSPFSVQ
jgi:hypothetical protein